MIKLVAAYSVPHRVIGCNGKLPWHYPEDLKVFRREVAGCTLLGGKNTLKDVAFLKQPTIEIHRDTDWDKIKELAKSDKFAIIGGQDVFAAGIRHAQFLELTEIHKEYTGDKYFPAIPDEFTLVDEVQSESTPELIFTTWWKKWPI